MQLIHANATIDELSSRISVMEVNMKNVSNIKIVALYVVASVTGWWPVMWNCILHNIIVFTE